MPKTLIAIVLLLSLSYQLFVKLGVVVWYEYNKDYIAKNLCENRNKPEKNCCGKCVLRKQLSKADENTTNPTNKTIPAKWNMGEVAVFILPTAISLPVQSFLLKIKMPLTNEQYLCYTPFNQVFRPPLVA